MKKLFVLLFIILSPFFIHLCSAQAVDIVSFGNITNPQGKNPYGDLIRVGNTLYGMTEDNSFAEYGNIFSVDTNGNNYQVLFDFDNANGAYPYGSLTYYSGMLYGMTSAGGLNNNGDIFVIDTAGNGYRDLWDFDGNNDNGAIPYGSLILSGVTLYGMTSSGGINNQGNIFSIDTNGSNYKDLWDFDFGGDTNGSFPYGSLTLLGNKLYGMTFNGGINSQGNIFKIDTNGHNYKDLWNFDGGGDTNGSHPFYGSLTFSENKFYGMTLAGGIDKDGNIFRIDTNGHNYKDLWNFDGGGDTNGSAPYGSLTLSAGAFYGMTSAGGIDKDGNIFSIDTNGNDYTNYWSFNNSNGANPEGDILVSKSQLYGMTVNGGSNFGVVFSFDINLNITIIKANISCEGENNGSAAAIISGGISPYTYLWTGGQSDSIATGLSIGTYTVYVHDVKGSEDSAIVNISQPFMLNSSANVLANINCYGENTGIAIVNVSGGTVPYTYLWSGEGGANDTATGLLAGTYSVTVTDACGKVATASATITQPNNLSVFANTTANVICNGSNNGSAESSVSGGIMPYTYLWTNGETNTSITGLTAGTYTLNVSDNKGCTNWVTAIITQPEQIIITSSSTDDNGTNNGTAMAIVSGGTSPYTYLWSSTPTQTTSVATGLSAGSYCCILTDNNGCTSTACITVESSAGIENVSNVSSINIYPDPNNGYFTVTGLTQGQLIELYNYLGQKLSSFSVNRGTIQFDISNNFNGIYLVKILNVDGTLEKLYKIVKTQ